MMHANQMHSGKVPVLENIGLLGEKNIAIKNYRNTAVDMLQLALPELSQTEICYAVDRNIAERIKYHPAKVDNSYKKTTIDITLPELTQFILSREPIMTTYGVLFQKHSEIPSPLYKMVDSFINTRDQVKKKMFTYPKGSYEFEKYSLLQLLYKLDANAFYGACGMSTCFYYNFYVAAATTAQGKSLNSAMALFFEMFLSNNVPFGCLNELIEFIHNVIKDEKGPIRFVDEMYLNHIPSMEEAFFKVMTSCGFGYIPTEKDLEIVWDIMSQLTERELTRLYYVNNLYEFCDNKYVSDLIVKILQNLQSDWSDSNHIPPEVENEVEHFYDLLKEYVYYPHQIIDRLDKMDCLVRNCSIIQDTDSAIVSYDAWYRFVLPKTRGVDMKIKKTVYDIIDETEEENTEVLTDYDFENDEVIEMKRLRNPFKVIPQDQLRHSILSILGNCISRLLNDYMYRYTLNSQAYIPKDGNHPVPKGMQCFIYAKTEFLFKRLLLTMAKKHYASYQELQEGNVVPKNKALDTKGMDAFNKSTSNDAIKKELKKILLQDIMDSPVIDQVQVVKSIAKVENKIYQSIRSGKKEFYKPAKVKSKAAYADPMRIQGIKASIAWNALHQVGTEALDLDATNAIDIAKVDINPKNIEYIQEKFPDVYANAVELMKSEKAFAAGIDTIGIPANEPVPEWLLPFVNYDEIINNNVGGFPLEAIGVLRSDKNVNKSNIVRF